MNGTAVMIAVLSGFLAFAAVHAFADEPLDVSQMQHRHEGPISSRDNQTGKSELSLGGRTNSMDDTMNMGSMDDTMNMGSMDDTMNMGSMDMGSMQGGSAPSISRDPNAYSDGYEYTSMPGMEKADQIYVGKVLLDQLEFTNGGEGNGVVWDAYAWYGPDENKLWLRSEGGAVNGRVDYTTSAEALWWRALTPFWGTLLGVHQDFGPGARTAVAFGVEGLAPYWFDLQATGYVDYDGRVSARLKASYDILFTNRLIFTPEVESNLYSKANSRRGIGAGVANVELSGRLRYEFSRKLAPYIGFDWDRALGGTVDLRRVDGEPVSDVLLVAGLRIWF